MDQVGAVFGERVRQLRAARGWSQATLGELMGKALAGVALDAEADDESWKAVAHQTVAKLEKGSRPTALHEAVALARVFGMSLQSLVEPIDHALGLRQSKTIEIQLPRYKSEIDEVTEQISAAGEMGTLMAGGSLTDAYARIALREPGVATAVAQLKDSILKSRTLSERLAGSGLGTALAQVRASLENPPRNWPARDAIDKLRTYSPSDEMAFEALIEHLADAPEYHEVTTSAEISIAVEKLPETVAALVDEVRELKDQVETLRKISVSDGGTISATETATIKKFDADGNEVES